MAKMLVRHVIRHVSRSAVLQNTEPFYVSSTSINLKQNDNCYHNISNQKYLGTKRVGIIGLPNLKGQHKNSQCYRYESTESGKGAEPDISKRISGLVAASDVVVFMKGIPAAPRCGFSNAVCQIFRMHNVDIDSHDVLADEELRQGIKEYSNWPTIPQVYFKGEFIGGCDILLQMHQSGELIEELEKIGIKSALLTAEEDKDKKDDK